MTRMGRDEGSSLNRPRQETAERLSFMARSGGPDLDWSTPTPQRQRFNGS